MPLLTTPFGATATAADVLAGVDLSGRRIVVTGGASGIGTETTRALAAAGAEVTIAVRSLAPARQLAHALGPGVRVESLDLADLASVRAFAARWDGPLDVLVNNAGVMATPEARTDAGVEHQLAVNHLGPWVLETALHGALAGSGGARVVHVSSTGHLFSPVVHDDPSFHFRPYDPLLAYGQSKTATIHAAVEAAARWARDAIVVNACNPGAIRTNLQRHVGGVLRSPPELHKTPAQGAATSVLLAASPSVEGVTGRYLSDGAEAEVVDRRPQDVAALGGAVAGYALDPDAARRTWALSERLAHAVP